MHRYRPTDYQGATVHSAESLLNYYLERNARRQGYIAAAEILDQTVTEAGAKKAEQCVDKQTKVVV